MGHVSTWDDCRFSVLEQVKPLLSTHRLLLLLLIGVLSQRGVVEMKTWRKRSKVQTVS